VVIGKGINELYAQTEFVVILPQIETFFIY